MKAPRALPHVASLGILALAVLTCPIQGSARTRTAVTLGDPDIGDNGQSPNPVQMASRLTQKSSQLTTAAARDNSITLRQLILAVKYGRFITWF